LHPCLALTALQFVHMSHALDEPSVLVQVQEELEPGKLRKVAMHVGGAVLRQVPYFEPQLGDELSGSSLEIRLPLRCSAEALSALLRRMYFKHLACENLPLDVILPMAQLARMLCLEGEHTELVQLLGRCVHTEADANKVIAWCASVEPSDALSKLAKSYERKGFMMDMDKELQEMIKNTIKNPGDGEAMTLIKKLLKKRAKKGSDIVQKNVNILKQVLVRGTLFSTFLPPRQPVQLSAHPGTAAFLQIVADLAITYPETFETTIPLMFSKFDDRWDSAVDWQASARRDMEKTAMYLLDRLPCQSLSGQAVGTLLTSLSRSGHLKSSCSQPLANVLKQLGQDEQVKISSSLQHIDASNMQAVASKAVLQSFVGDARVAVCKRLVTVLSTLDADTRTYLIHEMFGDSDSESG